MAAIQGQFRGTLYDLLTKSARQVFLDGDFFRSDVGVGGGPIYPPEGGGGPVDPGYGKPTPPDMIWGGGGQPGPFPPDPPSTWPPQRPPHPAHPIVIPPENLPPDAKPPEVPPPGSPSQVVPGGPYPVNPITPQPYYVFNWPGIGPVYIYPPAQPPTAAPQRR